jgi:hypothetical protein
MCTCTHRRECDYTEDNFYKKLETGDTGCLKTDIKIILGDLNAKVGFENQEKSVFGNCELPEEGNDNELN